MIFLILLQVRRHGRLGLHGCNIYKNKVFFLKKKLVTFGTDESFVRLCMYLSNCREYLDLNKKKKIKPSTSSKKEYEFMKACSCKACSCKDMMIAVLTIYSFGLFGDKKKIKMTTYHYKKISYKFWVLRFYMTIDDNIINLQKICMAILI